MFWILTPFQIYDLQIFSSLFTLLIVSLEARHFGTLWTDQKKYSSIKCPSSGFQVFFDIR